MDSISPPALADVYGPVCTIRHTSPKISYSRFLLPSKFLLVQSHALGAMKLHMHQLNLPCLLLVLYANRRNEKLKNKTKQNAKTIYPYLISLISYRASLHRKTPPPFTPIVSMVLMQPNLHRKLLNSSQKSNKVTCF